MASVNARVATYMLIVPIITFYVLTIVGCISSSAGVPNIFLIRLRQQGDSGFEFRVGYFGSCAMSKGQTMCIPTKGRSSNQVMSQIIGSPGSGQSSAKTIFDTGLEFQSTVIYWIILTAGILYMLGLVSLSLLKIKMKKTAHSLSQQRVTMCFLWTSTALAFAASLSVTQIVNTLEIWPTQSLAMETGTAVQVLQWLATSFSLLFSGCVWYMLKGPSGSSNSSKGELISSTSGADW